MSLKMVLYGELVKFQNMSVKEVLVSGLLWWSTDGVETPTNVSSDIYHEVQCLRFEGYARTALCAPLALDPVTRRGTIVSIHSTTSSSAIVSELK